MNKKSKLKIKDLFILAFAVLVSVFVGMVSGAYIMYETGTYTSLNTNCDVSSSNEIIEMYNQIISQYYGDVTEEDLTEAAIEGMFSILDNHTSYYDEGEEISFNNKLSGNFHGLGVEATYVDEGIYVVNVIDGAPAQIAGLQSNDIITIFNGESLAGKTAQEFTVMVSQAPDECTLTVLRDGNTIEFNVTLGNVTVTNVTGKVIETEGKKIGYIDFNLFSANSASQFKEVLTNLESNGIESLIIDVRDNSGGYLYQAKEILEMFLKKGQILYSIQSKTSKDTTKDTTDEHREYDIVILTNSNSASASEILSAALRDNLGAKLVGTTTYGKGSAQETTNYSTGMVKMTTKEWLTPSDICIDGVGLTPDYEVSLNTEYYYNPTEENDNQLQKAISLLK